MRRPPERDDVELRAHAFALLHELAQAASDSRTASPQFTAILEDARCLLVRFVDRRDGGVELGLAAARARAALSVWRSLHGGEAAKP